MKKTDRIEIRVTPEEKTLLVSKSKLANMTLSEYLIEQGLEKDIIVIEGLPKMFTELNRIGNNINQLTHLANSRATNCVDLEGTKKELQKIWQSLNLLTTKSI